MTLGISTRRYVALFTGVIVALVVAMSAMSGAARAEVWGGKLPGKSWTTGNGVVFTLHGLFASVKEGPPAICVGPVQWNGSSWVFPYGWNCGQGSITWEFAAINAAHGTDNPNSSADTFTASNW
jgi:hypothetical protein